MPSADNPDVIVIGAGLSGLAAAHRLANAGTTVLVLEARARAGGRVWTRRDDATSYPIELGPEWVEGKGEWKALLESVNAELREAEGHHVERRGSDIVDRGEMQSNMYELMEHLRKQLTRGDDLALLDALDKHASDASWSDARTMLLSYVRGFHAADPARVSVRWLAQVEESEPAEASQYHAVAGLDWGIDALCIDVGENCRIQFGAVVHHVEWQHHAVTVHAHCAGTAETFTAPQCVITLPLAILKLRDDAEGAVRFSPPLRSKVQPLRLLETGNVLKIAMVFRERFWKRDRAMAKVSFIHDFSQRVPTWWTTYPVDAPVMTGWLAGPPADKLAGVDGQARLDIAVTSLAHATGVSAELVMSQLVGWHSHDWASDPYARGGYSYVLKDGADAHKQLAEPVDDTLFFAGEATEGNGHNATMEGALHSGRRAAVEVLES